MRWYKLYLVNLLPYLAVMLLMLLAVAGFVTPNLYESVRLREMERYQNQIAQMSSSVESQLDYVRNLPMYIQDEAALRPSSMFSGSLGVVQAQEALRTLRAIGRTLYSVSLYYRETGRVLTETDYLTLDYYGIYTPYYDNWPAQEMHALLQTVVRGGVFIGEDTVRRLQNAGGGETVISYVAPIPYFSDTPYAAMLVSVSVQSLRKSFVPAGDGLTMALMYRDGEVVLSDHDTGVLASSALLALLKENDELDMAPAQLDGEAYYITITPSKTSGLCYMAVLSAAAGEDMLAQMRGRLLIILTGLSLAGLALCAYLCYRSTQPALLLLQRATRLSQTSPPQSISMKRPLTPVFQAINQLEQERDALATQNSMFQHSIGEVCLSRFLNGQYDTLPEIMDLCALAGIRFDGPYFCLLLMHCGAEQGAQSDLGALVQYLSQGLDAGHALWVSGEMAVLVACGSRTQCANVSGRLTQSEMWNGDTLTIWLSHSTEELASLPVAFGNLITQMRQSIFHEKTGTFIYPDDLTPPSATRRSVHTYQNMLMKALIGGQANAASNALSHIMRFIRHESTPHDAAMYVYQEARFMLFNAQPDGPDEGKAISGTARELCDDLTEMLSGVPWETQPQKTLSHQQLKEYVQTHLLDVDFSIATTAAAFGFSESAFSYQFKRIMRVNYLAYVNREKIQHAQRLLQCDANTIESIAARLGYANASNFSRMFKSITGMTPGQYRRSDAENPPPSNDDKGGPNNDNL